MEYFLGRLYDRYFKYKLLRNNPHLDNSSRIHASFVNSPSTRVNYVVIQQLDVQADFIIFAWDKHTRSIHGMNGCSIANIREIGVWNHVNDSPYVL